jgi:integrase/recombinase XerD
MLTVKRLRRDTGPVAAAGQAPYSDLVDAWLDDLSSAHTRDAYGRDLVAFITWCDVNGHDLLGVGVAEVSDYRDDCDDQGVRPATVARRLSALASFFAHALTAHAITSNPVDDVERPAAPSGTQPSGLDEHDALALLDAAGAVGPKVVVLVALLMLDGLKLAEALALDVDQLHGSGWSMRATIVRRGQAQDLALDGRTARAITAYLKGRTSGPLLVGESPTQDRSRRLTRFGADFLLKRAAGRAGLEPVSANTLRRTYIALSHRDGAAVEDISRRVGHASARDTRRYLP